MTPAEIDARYAPCSVSSDLVFVPARHSPTGPVRDEPIAISKLEQLRGDFATVAARPGNPCRDHDAAIRDALDLLAADLAAGRLRLKAGCAPVWCDDGEAPEQPQPPAVEPAKEPA